MKIQNYNIILKLSIRPNKNERRFVYEKKSFGIYGDVFNAIFSFATMTQAGYVNFDVTVAANGNHPDPLSPRMQKRIRKTGIMLHQQVLVILEKYEDFQKH